MNWDDAKAELSKPLDKSKVKPPPQGKYGEYVDAFHVIEEANRIFGPENWSYGVSELRLTNETQENGKHHIGYLALVTVDVGGVRKNDVGHGQGHGRSLGDAHDSAVKEAVTDGMKRALRTFGYTFGLALYDKTQANVADVAAMEDLISKSNAWLESATTLDELDERAAKLASTKFGGHLPDSVQATYEVMIKRLEEERDTV